LSYPQEIRNGDMALLLANLSHTTNQVWSWNWSWSSTDSQSPVRLGVGHSSGTRDQFFFLLEVFFRQLRVCYFVAPSLTRGRVSNWLLLLVPASAVPLWCEFFGTQDHILLSQFLPLPQPGGPGPRIYIPRNRVAKIYPRALGSLSVAPYDSGYGEGILSRLHSGKTKFNLKKSVHFNVCSVGAPPMVTRDVA
jgi:hypothetical protein